MNLDKVQKIIYLIHVKLLLSQQPFYYFKEVTIMKIGIRSLFFFVVIFCPYSFVSIFTVKADESAISLGGFIVSNFYENDSGVNGADVPNFAVSDSQAGASAGTLGGTVRESRLNLKATGPNLDEVWGSAKTSALLEIDFFGNFPNSTIAAAQPQP